MCEICGAEFDSPGKKGGHKRGHQLKTSREEIQSELRRLADEMGQTPTVGMMKYHGEYSPSTVKTHFDSWSHAVQSIGLEPNLRFEVTKAKLVEISFRSRDTSIFAKL